jgi:diguanylate cyclase (GGDEF)-like protein
MKFIAAFWEPMFLVIMGVTGAAGLLAMISPRAFAAVMRLGSTLVSATDAKTTLDKAPLDKWVDIDGYVLRHSRFFGMLVTGSVVYLALLSTYGPTAFSKPFLLLVVGVSLGTGIMALIELRKQKQQLDIRLLEAHTDVLTGLANRRSFDIELTRRIAQRQRQGTPLCLLILDVDHFKTFNDKYGHQVGDGVLKEVAQTLVDQVGPLGTVGRLGGDEFAVCLPGCTLPEGTLIAERVRTAVSSHDHKIEKVETALTVSVGVAEALTDDDEDSLMKRADSALYAAKEGGRNRSYRHGSPEPATPA